MASTSLTQKIQNASLVHIALLDKFIRVTQEEASAQVDSFTRESLNDLLATMRDERDGYVRLVEGKELVAA